MPLWLAQHPDILEFHQAPLEFGGQGTLSVLVELADWQKARSDTKVIYIDNAELSTLS